MVRKRSTAVHRRAPRMLHKPLEHWTVPAAAALLALALTPACAESSGAAAPVSSSGQASAAPGARDANLAGARCSGGHCSCRQRNGDGNESKPQTFAMEILPLGYVKCDG